MAEQSKKVKLSFYRDVAIMATVIPMYRKAMGYRTDSKLVSLAADAKAQIEYEIGDKLEEIRDEVAARVKVISEPFQKQASELRSDDPKIREIDAQIRIAINSDDDMKAISQRETKLWEKEIKLDLDPVEIPMLDYSERFEQEVKNVWMFSRNHNLDGYQALLGLHTMGLITYRTNEQ